MHRVPPPVVAMGSKVRAVFAELCDVTIVARSTRPAHSCSEIRLARETCAASRIVALRAAIADGRYRVDPDVIAAKLLMTLHLYPQLPDPLH